MRNFELLLVTMNQKNHRLIDTMNVETNIVIANQSDKFELQQFMEENKEIKFITTNTKGVGKNRNIALLFSNADICLLADDDEIFYENYREIILEAFNKIIDADVLIFNVNMVNDNSHNRINKKVIKINKFNFANYGAVRIAFKRESIMRKNIWFSTKFGGGAEFSSGEDSLFLKECLDKGLKIFAVPNFIADVKQEESSWFEGYNEKYFIDKGAFISIAFPKTKYLIAIYFSLKFRKSEDLNVFKIYSLILEGIRSY
ncbi:MAG: glycosyltransferase [Solibacillus sp.]